jgi:hypothetical protein
MSRWPQLFSTVFAAIIAGSQAYLPIFAMHGFSVTSMSGETGLLQPFSRRNSGRLSPITDSAGTFHDYDDIVSWLKVQHPGQVVIPLDINNGVVCPCGSVAAMAAHFLMACFRHRRSP